MPREELDSVSHARRTLGEGRAFEVLWEAQQYWLAMETFRRDRLFVTDLSPICHPRVSPEIVTDA